MFLDLRFPTPSVKEIPSLSKTDSLPTLSSRANSIQRRSPSPLKINTDDRERISPNLKRATSVSRTSSTYSARLNISHTKLYERMSATLVGKYNESPLHPGYLNKVLEKESKEKLRKASTLAAVTTAGTFENFLGSFTENFMKAVEQVSHEIPFDLNEPTENGLSLFIEKQREVYGMIKKVFEECVIGKLMVKSGLEDIGKGIVSIFDNLIKKYIKVVNSIKPQLKAKSLLSEQKEQQALMVTKNERVLFECVKLVNCLNNPLFQTDEETRQKYIHDLIKHKQFLRENKTSFRIDTVNNFEEDLKRLQSVYIDIKGQNEIILKENQRLRSIIHDVNNRYEEDQKLLFDRNEQTVKQKVEEQEKAEKLALEKIKRGNKSVHSLSGIPGDITSDRILLSQISNNFGDHDDHYIPSMKDSLPNGGSKFDRAMTLVAIARGKESETKKNAESQTFVIQFLTREMKTMEAELQRIKQELERIKAERNHSNKRTAELEEILKVKKARFKNTGSQCTFNDEKESVVETESTLAKMIEGKDPFKGTGIEQTEEWLLTVINMIYQEKFQADLQDDFEGRPRKSLGEFCKEWFLSRFGLQHTAEVFLRDFLKTLTEYLHVHPRYKTFGMLIGIAEAYDSKLPDVLGTGTKDESVVVREFFKRQFIMSHYGNSIFNKAVLTIKASACSSDFETFLPNCEREEDSVEMKGLMPVLRDFLRLLDLPADEIKLIILQFDQMVEGDRYFKLLEKQHEKGKGKLVIEEEIQKGELSVRMDYYLHFILENTALSFIKDLERIYTQIRLANEFMNISNLSIDLYKETFSDLGVEKSQRWFDVTFEALLQKDIKHSPPLTQTLAYLVPNILAKAHPPEKYKLPEDGYPVFQKPVAGIYNEKDVQARVKKWIDIEGNYNLLKITFTLMKGTLTKHQRRAGNVEMLYDLIEKDMANIRTVIQNTKFTQRASEKEKLKYSLEQNWKRLRTIIKVKHFVPKESTLTTF